MSNVQDFVGISFILFKSPFPPFHANIILLTSVPCNWVNHVVMVTICYLMRLNYTMGLCTCLLSYARGPKNAQGRGRVIIDIIFSRLELSQSCNKWRASCSIYSHRSSSTAHPLVCVIFSFFLLFHNILMHTHLREDNVVSRQPSLPSSRAHFRTTMTKACILVATMFWHCWHVLHLEVSLPY